MREQRKSSKTDAERAHEHWRCPLCEGDELPTESPLDLLRESGVELPPPELLGETALRDVLWDAVEALASMGIYILSTDHLSDRQLYALLCESLLREPVWGEIDPPDGAVWIDVIGGGSDEDIDLYLRYYAGEDDREAFAREFGEPLPPRCTPPFDRDRYMPRRETFWSGRWVPPPWRTSGARAAAGTLGLSRKEEAH